MNNLCNSYINIFDFSLMKSFQFDKVIYTVVLYCNFFFYYHDEEDIHSFIVILLMLCHNVGLVGMACN